MTVTQQNDNNEAMKRMPIQVKFITNGALEVNLERNTKLVPTIGFQIADVVKKNNQRVGDWKNKFVFQLNPDHELIQLINVLTRRIETESMQWGIQFKYHGPERDKMLTLKYNNDGSLAISGMQKSKNIRTSVIIQPTAIAQLLTLAYKAYASRFKIQVSEAITLLNMSPIAELPK